MGEEKFWREPYRAPSFSGAIVQTLVIIFAGFSLVRGVGFVFDTNANSSSPQGLALHLQLWGWGLMVGSVYLITSIAFSRKFFVWTAHVLMCAFYLGLLMDLTDVVLQDNGDGYRGLLVPLGGVVWHAVFVRQVRPFGKAERRSV